MLSMTTCGDSGAVDGCAWVQPVITSEKDQLTPNTARQIDVLYKTWERNCRQWTN